MGLITQTDGSSLHKITSKVKWLIWERSRVITLSDYSTDKRVLGRSVNTRTGALSVRDQL